jgi:hypothetical protein
MGGREAIKRHKWVYVPWRDAPHPADFKLSNAQVQERYVERRGTSRDGGLGKKI